MVVRYDGVRNDAVGCCLSLDHNTVKTYVLRRPLETISDGRIPPCQSAVNTPQLITYNSSSTQMMWRRSCCPSSSPLCNGIPKLPQFSNNSLIIVVFGPTILVSSYLTLKDKIKIIMILSILIYIECRYNQVVFFPCSI